MRKNKYICVFDGSYMNSNATENAILQRRKSENVYIPVEYNNFLRKTLKKVVN
jgi:hypothetical protein